MVGSDKTTRVNIRVIAASNRNLRQLVEDERFRADLYYRLAVIPLDLPSLHERPCDIQLLMDHFMEKLATRGYPSELMYRQNAISMILETAVGRVGVCGFWGAGQGITTLTQSPGAI